MLAIDVTPRYYFADFTNDKLPVRIPPIRDVDDFATLRARLRHFNTTIDDDYVQFY